MIPKFHLKILKLLVPIVIGISIPLLLVSCKNVDWKKIFPRNTFDSQFPKNNKDLSSILGSRITLKIDNDTIKLKIGLKGDRNLITMERGGDTVFCGTVCKFKGLYYLSQKINDTSYWIFALKKSGDKLYGINGMLKEELKIDKEVLSGKYPTLLKSMNKDTSVIRLHTDKKLIREILDPYMDSLKPFTILSSNALTDTVTSNRIVFPIDSEELE